MDGRFLIKEIEIETGNLESFTLRIAQNVNGHFLIDRKGIE